MPKLLAQFLQEQQEPFALESYLLERGCHIGRKTNARAKFGLKKRRNNVTNCSNFLNFVLGQIVAPSNDKKIKNSRNRGRGYTSRRYQKSVKGEENAEEDEIFSESSTVIFNSCSESDAEDAHCCEPDKIASRSIKNCGFHSEKEVVADEKLKFRAEEDNKQLSPVSVLDETEWNEGSPIHYEQCNSKSTAGESSTSTASLKRPTYTYNVRKSQELVSSDSDSYTQYIINKRILRQTKQLLIDCTREVIENHRKRDKRRERLKNILGVDELWKLVCENVWLWSQDSIDENNIIHLLQYDYLASEEEWSDGSKQQKREISMELGDAILDNIINEIVMS